ncbi:hypothetical protein [Desertibacillus haloalkaliphilus]|uniref:hypothetical protein n=1 Tax=Desertibacillus haloalkaliphilus TaxID=1328930 RepID=UPI001C25149D|nr:hypothetical protein [Desertibacillus haloalkaliphilus]MBU8905585.1 hypothetical protein [Desertibacillus haloalkaliphilus]
MNLENLSLIPDNYKDRDPRNLLYHFPSMPKVKFAKLMNKFYYFKALEAVEEAARKNGFILVPFQCMHWKRKKDYALDRKVKCCGRSFFMMKVSELTSSEKNKLIAFLEENDLLGNVVAS